MSSLDTVLKEKELGKILMIFLLTVVIKGMQAVLYTQDIPRKHRRFYMKNPFNMNNLLNLNLNNNLYLFQEVNTDRATKICLMSMKV